MLLAKSAMPLYLGGKAKAARDETVRRYMAGKRKAFQTSPLLTQEKRLGSSILGKKVYKLA